MKLPNKVDTIIFDAGGVLFYINEYRNDIMRRVMLSLGYEESAVDRAIATGKDFDTYYFNRGNALRTWKDEKKWLTLRSDVIAKALDDDNEDLPDRLKYTAFDTHQYKLFNETVEILERLKASYKLSVISNATASLDWAFDHLDIRKYFDEVVISAYEECEKPEALIYERTLEKLGCSAKRCVFVDDCLENVNAAVAIGMSGYHLQRDDGMTLYHFEDMLK